MGRVVLSCAALACAVFLAAGCGSSRKHAEDETTIATVEGTPIPKAHLDRLLTEARAQFDATHRPFPAPGTSGYRLLQDRAVRYLVGAVATEKAAARMGVRVPDAQVDAAIEKIVQKQFGGDEEKFEAAVRRRGATRDAIARDERLALTQVAVTKKLHISNKVSTQTLRIYYTAHKLEFTFPKSRAMREIRVKQVRLARKLYRRLKAGADFEQLAVQYSIDKAAKSTRGRFVVTDKVGNAYLDRVAFSLRRGEISAPIATIYGWHILQAVGPVRPARTLTYAQALPQMRATILKERRAQRVAAWTDDVTAALCGNGKLTYDPDYRPQGDRCGGTS